MRFTDKTAAITGGAQGIGLAAAERFLAEGARGVALFDIDAKALAEAASRLPADRVVTRALDVSQPEAVATAFAALEDRWGGLDILVNSAGVSFRSAFLDLPAEKWARVIAINLTGTFLCGQAAARIMARRGGKGGRIINIASTSGLRGSTGRSAYGASKGGVINLTRAMAVELGEHGITVNAIAPGPVKTGMANHDPVQQRAFFDRMAIRRFGTPEEVAAAAAFLASDEAGFITAEILSVDGGFNGAGMIMDMSQMAPSARALP
jgi:NAD(P)-dependent dehydrogenase (short-subunit alcohol dehydrogenase family)